MPLVGSPGTGYPDGQRLANYDSGPLWNIGSVTGNTPVVSPVMNMQHFAAAGGYIIATVGIATVQMTWYADALLVTEISAKTFQIDHNIPAALGGLMIPNLGPFLQVTVSAISGGNFGVNAVIFGSNRVSPIPWIPQNGLLINIAGAAIGAGQAIDSFPSDYYAGPCMVWFAGPAAQSFITLLTLGGNGGYNTNQQISVAANGEVTEQLVMPSGAWKMTAQQVAGGASTYDLTVIPSLTGST